MKRFLPILMVLLGLGTSGCGRLFPLQGEGHQGMPWGTTLSQYVFRKHSFYIWEKTGGIGIVLNDTMPGEVHDPQLNNRVHACGTGGQFLETLIRGKDKDGKVHFSSYNVDDFQNFFGGNLTNAYVRLDDTTFCFYDDVLFAAIAPLSEDDFGDTKKEFDAKKGKGIELKPIAGTVLDGDQYVFTAYQYSQGANTDIYLVKVREDLRTSEDPLMAYALVYTSRDRMKQMEKGFADFKADQKKK